MVQGVTTDDGMTCGGVKNGVQKIYSNKKKIKSELEVKLIPDLRLCCLGIVQVPLYNPLEEYSSRNKRLGSLNSPFKKCNSCAKSISLI